MTLKKQQQEMEKTLALLSKATDKLLDIKDKKGNVQEDKDLGRFKQVELLSHVVAYIRYLDDASMTKKISIKDEDGVKRFYNVRKIATNNDGLVPYVLYADEPDNPRVHVLFRGTDNKASMRRDLETMGAGPGSISFEKNKSEILRTIKDVVKHKQQTGTKNVELNLAGHSLGGADVQMCATAIMEDVANNPKDDPLAKIKCLNIMHANSAGVTYATAKKAASSLEAIKKQNSHFKVNQYIIHVGGDLVQQGGQTTILAKAANKNVETHLLKAELEHKHIGMANKIRIFAGKVTRAVSGKNAYVAHTHILFHGKVQHIDVKFNIYNNKIPGEDLIIEKNLKHKILSRLYSTFSPKKLINRLGKLASRIYRPHHHHKKNKHQ